MATISGRVVFDRDRSASISSGDSGLSDIPVVLQDTVTTARLTVLTDASGNYSFLNVPDGTYRIVESYGIFGGVPTPGNFASASTGSVPQGVNPPITAAVNPPPGSTNLDSVTPNTLLVTVSGVDLTNQNFLNGPVVYTPVQEILDPCAVVSGGNLIDAADSGTFGTFPQGTLANTGAPSEPYPDVTPDFTYVLPDPAIFAPLGGEYTVQNIMNNSMSSEIGAWWRIADHTEGNETGRFMVVNGFNPGAVFFRDVVTVQPNTNYLFTAWILNLFKVNGFPNPELGVRVLDENGGVLYNEALGTLVPVNTNAPEWKQIGSVVNSRDNASLTVEFLSESPEVIGNDYAIDDISLREIMIPEFVPVKTVDSQTANVGDAVRYTVTLENACTSPLTGLFFRDAVPNGLVFIPGSVVINQVADPDSDPNAGFILPDVLGGETVTVEFSAEVTGVPVPNPALNRADITYSYTPVEGGIPGIFNVTSNEVPVEVDALTADLSVVKTVQPATSRPGELLTYTVAVTNNGPGASQNVVLYDEAPPELLNVQFSTDGGATWNPWVNPLALGQLTSGQTRTVLIRGTVAASACGTISNTAVAAGTTPDPNPGNNTDTANSTVQTGADLSLLKSAAPNPVDQCERLTYTLTVFNAGPETAKQVILTDRLPMILCNPVYSVDGGQTWHRWTGNLNLGNLPAGGSLSVLLAGTVRPCAAGMVENTATVFSLTFDPDLSNNTASASVTIR